jgi:NAD(P)H-hydrate epimerase
LREPIRAAARAINQLRASSNAQVFAVDLPTGLDGDTGAADPDCVVADFTLTVGFAKKGLVADSAANHVGRLAVLSLQGLDGRESAGDSTVATGASLAGLLPRRKFDSNKGDYGRVGIIAGSLGATGAAVMSAEGALRAGAGLITLFATPDIYHALAVACPPEIMVRPVSSYVEALEVRLDVVALGPGLGSRDGADILHIVETCPLPMVVDADGLNLISGDPSLLTRCAGKRLLTPHPGEMARLLPEAKNLSRRETAEKFTAQYPVTLLLKGSRTIVAERGAPLSYNTTGSPGMATGGMGDTLTGVCAALIGQGLSCRDAARAGAWVCGRAAEIAIYNGAQSEESLAATDLAGTLGTAFKQLQAGCF